MKILIVILFISAYSTITGVFIQILRSLDPEARAAKAIYSGVYVTIILGFTVLLITLIQIL